MAKQKVQHTHKSVRVQREVLDSIIDHVSKTRQTISGFIELAVDEKLQRESIPTLAAQEWPVKNETK